MERPEAIWWYVWRFAESLPADEVGDLSCRARGEPFGHSFLWRFYMEFFEWTKKVAGRLPLSDRPLLS